jgi:hypothetical protein
MSKKAPSTSQLLVITGFAFSCFGILLFMWITFGGPTPFKAKPYEIKIPFNEATQLAEQSDVRISGVSIGKVQSIGVAPNGKQALATVDIDDKYGPIPENSRAILRTKTLLGETYIELTPGSSSEPALEDGGTLPEANIAESVQLDEIFRTFNPPTRAAFQEWMRNGAIAIEGRGQDLSAAFGQFGPTLTEFDKLFRVLDSQELAVRQLFRNRAAGLPRPRRGARRPDPELERRLPDDRHTRTGHRSPVPRLPHLPRRIPDHLEPAPHLLRQHRPAAAPAGAGGRTALADAAIDRQALT